MYRALSEGDKERLTHHKTALRQPGELLGAARSCSEPAPGADDLLTTCSLVCQPRSDGRPLCLGGGEGRGGGILIWERAGLCFV